MEEKDEIQELSDEYKENSESDHEVRRKGITLMRLPRSNTQDSKPPLLKDDPQPGVSTSSQKSPMSYLPFLNNLNKKIKEKKTSMELKNILFGIRKDVIQRNSYRIDPRQIEELANMSTRNKLANLQLFERNFRASRFALFF